MRALPEGLSVFMFLRAEAERGFNRPNRKVSYVVFKSHLMVTMEGKE